MLWEHTAKLKKIVFFYTIILGNSLQELLLMEAEISVSRAYPEELKKPHTRIDEGEASFLLLHHSDELCIQR